MAPFPSRPLTASAVLVLLMTLAALPVLAAPVEVGYRDHSYAASGVSAPTAEKPQSKLWYTDGSWWGALFSLSSDAYNIWRLDWASQTWSDTGVVIDPRNTVHLDALWDGAHLYVASHGKTASAGAAQIRRFSYNPATDTYSLDAGFPVQLVSGGMEAGVIDKDTTGTVWFTYTRSNAVWVTRTNGNDLSWVTPYVIPTSGAINLTSDDISAIVAYDGKIGVMWSNANDWAMHFAIHVDGAPDLAWTLNTAVREPEYADDHMNLKSLQTDGEGRVYAVTKTSLNASSAPLMLVLILDSHGNWQRRTFGTVADNHTRPLLLIDNQNRKLYVFAASPCCSGGVIYYKQSPLDNVNFASGKGTPFIQSSTDTTINHISSTKQPLNSTTGLVAIAGDDHSRRYLHNAFTLGGGGGDTTPPAPPSPHPFTDISDSPFETEITWAYLEGVTAGCTSTRFCPLKPVTREQMASFLVRALALPATSTDFFTDDETSIHEPDINSIAASGITAGCTGSAFCPAALVTREQMASFLARAFSLPPAASDYFTDDERSIHESDINRLARSAITTGCTRTHYCPRDWVTREQMVAFFFRALR